MARIKLKLGENEIEVDSRDFYVDNQTLGEIIDNISQYMPENQNETDYEIKLKFENPSLLTLPSGQTEFFVSYDDEIVGKGNLESFTLYPLSTSSVEGTFTANTSSDESKSVKISGVIKYDLLVTSIDVPFDYYPNEEQTRKFIQ